MSRSVSLTNDTAAREKVVSVTGDTYVQSLPIDLYALIMRVDTAWNVGGANPDPCARPKNGFSAVPWNGLCETPNAVLSQKNIVCKHVSTRLIASFGTPNERNAMHDTV